MVNDSIKNTWKVLAAWSAVAVLLMLALVEGARGEPAKVSPKYSGPVVDGPRAGQALASYFPEFGLYLVDRAREHWLHVSWPYSPGSGYPPLGKYVFQDGAWYWQPPASLEWTYPPKSCAELNRGAPLGAPHC